MGNEQPRQKIQYTEEEKKALKENSFVRLPCYENPFLQFGQSKLTAPDISDKVRKDEGSPASDEGEKGEAVVEAEKKEEGEKEKELETDSSTSTSTEPARWRQIVEVLSREITNLEQLEQAFNELNPGIRMTFFHGYLPVAESERSKKFFGETLPKIQKLALRLPELFPKEDSLPILLPYQDAEVTLTQEQIACLMCHAFFCTFYETESTSIHDYNSMSFALLYGVPNGPCASTATCIVHYLERVTEKMPDGVVTFRRQVLDKDHIPNWSQSTTKITTVKALPTGRIEDCDAPLHADFANEYIGGGVLHGGCVQEEILFAIKTECLISLLFCPRMDSNEVIFITGAERFSNYQGYGGSYKFGGDCVDQTPRDEHKRIKTSIVAMDAVMSDNFRQWSFVRDLNKAYCAFWVKDPTAAPEILPGPIATGNWGCGAFGGDKSVKFFQQMLAASEAGRELWWYTFNEGYKGNKLEMWINATMRLINQKGMNVGDVYRLLEPAIINRKSDNLFEYFAMAATRQDSSTTVAAQQPQPPIAAQQSQQPPIAAQQAGQDQEAANPSPTADQP